MRRRHVQSELLDEPRQTRRLPFGQLEHESRQGSRVDDRMLERALQSATHQPRVECVVTVLDQHGALRETQERTAHILELGRADQHRAVDMVALSRVGVDRCAAVDQRVKEGKRLLELETFGAELEHEKGRVSRRLDVERNELRVIEQRLRPQLRRVHGDLFPRHRLGCAAWLEEDAARRRGRRAHLATASARRAQRISSPSIARKSSTATA
jgi:hypothetical protein